MLSISYIHVCSHTFVYFSEGRLHSGRALYNQTISVGFLIVFLMRILSGAHHIFMDGHGLRSPSM
jgi:hypothetical protein